MNFTIIVIACLLFYIIVLPKYKKFTNQKREYKKKDIILWKKQ